MDKGTLYLIEGYLERAREKLKSAVDLLKANDWDDCVSRAYYCAFHATQALLLSEGLSADTHQGIRNLFGLYFVKTGKFDKRFARILSNLKDDRENGDYEIFSAIDKESAEESLKKAGEFLEKAEQYLKKYLKKGK
ncbi:MAG: HEPN domain-containing protein [Candidatus Omnitrophota bacterium]